MWFFNSPEVVFGDDAMSYLENVQGRRAFIVTDRNIAGLGFVERVKEALAPTGMEVSVFDEVEPDPSLETARRGARAMTAFQPDWIIGLGGGSCMDAAKAMWILYERPDVAPEAINPMETLGLRRKARLIAIPTTSGTGAEATWAMVLTDTAERCKLGLASREALPDMAIVDPSLVMNLPQQITADTGMDVLTHAVEGYTSSWHNDFSDGLCLKAVQLVFDYLPRAYHDGGDAEAREHMHNAATIAGLGFINSMAALAHSMGHSLGGIFHTPHGRAVGLFLPYSGEYISAVTPGRFAEIARFLGLPAADDAEGARSLVEAVRDLATRINQPGSIADLGITEDAFRAELDKLIENAESDSVIVAGARIPDSSELRRLFEYAYQGRSVDF